MKKHFLILLALVCLIAACKLDESGFNQNSANGSTDTSGSIVGMWFIKSQRTTGTILGIETDNTETNFTTQDYYLFNSDNTVKFSSADSIAPATSTYNYNATAKKLIIANDGGTFTISKLTKDSLIMKTLVSIPEYAIVTNVTLKLTH